jgi:methyl-accepting chemotaxis protein
MIRVGAWMILFISIVGAGIVALPYDHKDVNVWATYALFAVGATVGVYQILTTHTLADRIRRQPRLTLFLSVGILLWTTLLHWFTGGLYSPFMTLYLVALLAVAQLNGLKPMIGMVVGAEAAIWIVTGLKGQWQAENLPLIVAWSAMLLLISGYSTNLVTKLRRQVTHREQVQQEMNHLVTSVQTVSTQVAASAEQLSVSSEEMHLIAEEVAGSAHDIATGADLQAEHVADTARAIGRLNASTQSIAANAKATGDALQQVSDEVMQGHQLLDVLGEHTQEIDRIVGFVERIHDQTELLALNAAIEAARAGEHGRGFAVVAQEVRKLSENSYRAVGEIAELSRQIRQFTATLNHSMAAIANAIHDSAQLAEATIEATQQQESGAQNIVNAMNEVAIIVEENAATTARVSDSTNNQVASFEQVSISAQELAQMSGQLQKFVEQLHVLPRAAEEAVIHE